MIHGALRDGRRRAANAPSTRFAFLCSRPTAWRAFATSSAQGAKVDTFAHVNAIRSPRKRARPLRKQALSDLVALERLELCLPPHLRSSADGSAPIETSFVPNAPQTAELALEAFYGFKRGFLPILAVEQGRWRAAVWLVDLLVKHYHLQPARSDRLSHTIQTWNRTGSLDDVTDRPIYPKPHSGEPLTPHIRISSSASLEELTNDKPDTLSRAEILRHKILGLIWRDIGKLIIECASNHDIAGGEVKHDVLEMIALLHHHELMPESIYAYVPAQSKDAIQQPPTLHLLSRRIFTALSDATWRARELSALEKAKRQGGELTGLEAKGSSYRVRVPGIKPEIWLELILWSCLHGGWVSEGAGLLVALRESEGGKWTPISWRDSLNAVIPSGQEDQLDWDSIRYMFDTRSNATMDRVDITGLRVDKTVSSEVVNAYIDALLDVISVGVGSRGLDPEGTTNYIRKLRGFLQRANLNLGGGTWDAMVLRLVESGGIDVDQDPKIMRKLVELSPPIGEELQSRRSQAIPSYVLDGSAAILGLLHRALYAEIKNGNLEGALKSFQLLQERIDNDRNQSLRDFFAHKHLSTTEPDKPDKGLFTSNFSGIDYPSFSTQIPSKTLAAFLELVIANKSFELGDWMLGIDNTDVDGPLIPVSLYSDPHISAAVVHYATVTNNNHLLLKLTKSGAVQVEGDNHEPTLSKELLQAFLNAQIELRRWDAVEKILALMRDTDEFDWSVGNAATLAKAMIIESQGSTITDQQPNFTRAEQLFASLLAGKYGMIRRPSAKQESVNTLCVVLATVSPLLAATVRKNQALPNYFNFSLRAGAFNSVLEGVVATLGSRAGQALINIVAIARRPRQLGADDDSPAAVTYSPPRIPSPMPRFMQDAVDADVMPRTNLTIPCAGEGVDYTQNVAMYGGFGNISLATARIIVRQALAERSQQKLTSHGGAPSLQPIVSALISLCRAGLAKSALRRELLHAENGLTADEMRNVESLVAEEWIRPRTRTKKKEFNVFHSDPIETV